MARDELLAEIGDGVAFSVAAEEERLLGVMGIQDKGNVVLIRHDAYVARDARRDELVNNPFVLSRNRCSCSE